MMGHLSSKSGKFVIRMTIYLAGWIGLIVKMKWAQYFHSFQDHRSFLYMRVSSNDVSLFLSAVIIVFFFSQISHQANETSVCSFC